MDWDGFCANPLDFARLCAQRRECCTQLPTFFLLHVMGQDQCTLAEAGG